MGQFEDAALEALAMSDVNSFVAGYLRAKNTPWPAKSGEEQTVLNLAAVDCTYSLLTRILEGLLEYARQCYSYEAGVTPTAILSNPSSMNILKDKVTELNADDYLLNWFITSGANRIMSLAQSATAKSAEDLYKRLRLSSSLEDALRGAKAAGADAYSTWLIEALEQYYEAFGTTAAPADSTGAKAEWPAPKAVSSWTVATHSIALVAVDLPFYGEASIGNEDVEKAADAQIAKAA